MCFICAGKTTLLKSKAVSLAQAGEVVTLIFMGGSGKTEAVMSIANKLDFANYPNVTVLSQQDLEEKYRKEYSWRPWLPSPLSLLKFYIEKEKPQHVMVDEAPFETSLMNACDLDKTGSLLNSLLPLFPQSSFLWLALHSSPLTDYLPSVQRNFSGLSKETLENWRSRLSQTFTIPTLQHNLRNSNEVASASRLGIGASSNSPQSEALPTAPAPRPLPTLPPTPLCLPILLPLHSNSQLGEAIRHIASLEEPGTLVVLLDDLNQQDVVKTSLAQEGLNVVTYTKPAERTSCKKFLENPKGALVTTSHLFSGMEAANVICVRVKANTVLQRSNRLRAIHRLCLISSTFDTKFDEVRQGTWMYKHTFEKCHNFPVEISYL